MGTFGGEARTALMALMARPLWLVGVAAMIVAAVVAEVFGLLARAIDVPMEAPGMGGDEAEKIFVGGFVVATFFYGVIGILVAVGARPMGKQPGSSIALSHLLVAAIMIPPIAQRLAVLESNRPEVTETPTD